VPTVTSAATPPLHLGLFGHFEGVINLCDWKQIKYSGHIGNRLGVYIPQVRYISFIGQPAETGDLLHCRVTENARARRTESDCL
jgi:hypothetical protein